MTAFSATAPGKLILFGEHAVVYGQPAIAVPVNIVKARAVVSADPHAPTGQVHIIAPDISLDAYLADLPAEQPLALAITLTAEKIGATRLPAMQIQLTSSIPLAAGFGSSAASSVAVIRAVASFLGSALPDHVVSDLAYQVEKHHHGNPSGIDNTVIAFNRPVYFVRGQPFETLPAKNPFMLVIADSGLPSSTAAVVADVGRLCREQPQSTGRLFTAIGDLSRQARTIIQNGRVEDLGDLMNQNQQLLQDLTISSPQLEILIEAARSGGASGAKLSGGGRGGNIIALVSYETAHSVEHALITAGALRTWITTVPGAKR
ncbi:MAG TPA: mevalonate kinase [Longilinea sp.]|nr:mevalonate kinase [Longilinea sp.]